MPADDSRARTPEGVFGKELRYYRERAGLSQTELAALVNVSHDVISKIETGDRPPAEGFPERLDAVPELDTRNGLARLWGWLAESARHRVYPGWFDRWPDFEEEAVALRWYEPLLVPGLLQTEDYARAVLRGAQGDASDDEIEQQVTARLHRQDILTRASAPHLWAIVDEGVLHRTIGDAKTMLDQLWHLARASEQPKVSVQVIPFAAGARTGLLGHFVIARLREGASIAYLETAADGQIVETPAVIDQVTLTWEALRSEALPAGASRELIIKIAEGKWT